MSENIELNGDYELLLLQAKAIVESEPDFIANLANLSALINQFYDQINWAGFYLVKNNELVLGPFQGKVACTHIQFGKGVCGTAVASNRTQLVKDVHQFPGHIACDSASNSEIVVCIHSNNKIVGVIDIDSPEYSRFNETDQHYLEQVSDIIGTLF